MSAGALDKLHNGYANEPSTNQNPAAREPLYAQDKATLAIAAMDGHRTNDFNRMVQDMVASGGKVDPADPKYNEAGHMLQSGVYDDAIGGKAKAEENTKNLQNLNRAKAQGDWVIAAQKQQNQNAIDDKFSQVYPQIVAGNYSPQQAIKDFAGDGKAMEHAINQIQKQQEPGIVENSPAFNHVIDRINSDGSAPGHIDTPAQVRDALAQANIPGKYYTSFISRLDKSPAGEVNRQSEKSILAFAKTRLESSLDATGNVIPGMKNPYAGIQYPKVYYGTGPG